MRLKSILRGAILASGIIGASPAFSEPYLQGSQIFDPTTGALWAPISATVGMSYNDVTTNLLAPGDPYAGYHYASAAELGTLFLDAGIPLTGAGYCCNPNSNVQALIALFGSTYSGFVNPTFTGRSPTGFTGAGQATGFYAIFDDALPGNPNAVPYGILQFGDNSNTYADADDQHSILMDQSNPLTGSFLVKGVPELSTWAMLLIGFAGIGFAAHRRRSLPRYEVSIHAVSIR